MNVEKFPPPFLLLGEMLSGAAAVEKGRAVSQIKQNYHMIQQLHL